MFASCLHKSEIGRYILVLVCTMFGASWVSADPGIELLNQTPATGDRMGYSVTIDGQFAAVGTRLDDANGLTDSGSVEIFKQTAVGTWLHHQTLVSPVPGASFHFGHAVGISGDFLIVGEETSNVPYFRSGAAHLFKKDSANNDQWVWTDTASPSGLAARDYFGRSVAIDNSIFATTNSFVVGALNADTYGSKSGRAVVFDYDVNGSITNSYELNPGDGSTGDNFGNAVSIVGGTVAVGSFRDDDSVFNSGSVYIFERVDTFSSAVWGLQQKLVAIDPAVNDQFGYSVSLGYQFEETEFFNLYFDLALAVGSRLSDGLAGGQIGAVYTYSRSVDDQMFPLISYDWLDHTKLTASDAAAGDRFGTSVALNDYGLVVGAPEQDDLGDKSGKAYYFKYDAAEFTEAGFVPGTGWAEEAQLLDEETTTRDEFGVGVALENGNAVVGAWLDNRPQNNSGAAYIFELD